jgi:hypothetical protein
MTNEELLAEIKAMVIKYPNDDELGGEIRKLIRNNKTMPPEIPHSAYTDMNTEYFKKIMI